MSDTFTLTSGYSWVNGDVVTATRLNLGDTQTLAAGQKYTFGDGTNAAPSVNFTSDPTSGFYFGASSVGVAIGGVALGLFSATGLAITGLIAPTRYKATPSTLTYAASTAIDFGITDVQTVTLAGNVTFTTTNLAAGTSKTLRIIGDGSTRTFTFPAGWTFVGTGVPASIAAGKTALLSLLSYSTTDANVIAGYSVSS
jgi:hypothetical protein